MLSPVASPPGGADKGLEDNCAVVDPTANVKIKCVGVAVLVHTPTTRAGRGTATLSGTAEVNGVRATYRVGVTDAAELGRDKDTFAIQSASGYTAGRVLNQGNVQVHCAK